MFKNLRKKIVYLFGVVFTFVFVNTQYVFADVSASTLGDAVQQGINIAAAIPALIAVGAFINAGISFSQAQQEGGNGQASAKASNSLAAGVVAVIVALAILGPLGGVIKTFSSSAG